MDVWSAGCIMAEMITGKTLFKGSDRILRLWGGRLGLGGGWACRPGQVGVCPALWPRAVLLTSAQTWTS